MFSIGVSIPHQQSGKYVFIPRDEGLVNRRFSDITANGLIYCYELGGQTNPEPAFNAIVMQLADETTLHIEKWPVARCGTGPWRFGSEGVDFKR